MNHNQSGEISKAMALQRQTFAEVDGEEGEPLRHAPGISTTESIDLLTIEAELVADGKDLDNPHIPLNQATLSEAKAEIKADGNTPAWSQ